MNRTLRKLSAWWFRKTIHSREDETTRTLIAKRKKATRQHRAVKQLDKALKAHRTQQLMRECQ